MLFSVIVPAAARTLLYDGITTMIVEAVNSAAALALVKAEKSDDNDVIWDNATITAIPQNLLGVTFSIATSGGISVSYTGIADDTWEEVAVALQNLLVVEGLVATWTVESVNEIAGTLVIALGNAAITVDTPTLSDAGHGYEVSDVLTVIGGTSTTAATVTVSTVDAIGAVTGITITEPGVYTTAPGNDAATSGGGGTGCTLTLTWGDILLSAVSATQGTGYSVDDILTLVGGTVTTAATVRVATIGGGGEVTSVTVETAGDYTTAPGSPITTTGGGDNACTLTGTWGEFVKAIGAVAGGGVGYEVADTLTLVGGTSTTTATLTVATVSAGGVATVTIADAGVYSVVPSNPVAVTGGSGSDAAFDVVWDDHDNLGDETLTVTVVDAAANDLKSEFIDEETDGGAATDNLSVDILSTGTSDRIIGQFKD